MINMLKQNVGFNNQHPTSTATDVLCAEIKTTVQFYPNLNMYHWLAKSITWEYSICSFLDPADHTAKMELHEQSICLLNLHPFVLSIYIHLSSHLLKPLYLEPRFRYTGSITVPLFMGVQPGATTIDRINMLKDVDTKLLKALYNPLGVARSVAEYVIFSFPSFFLFIFLLF